MAVVESVVIIHDAKSSWDVDPPFPGPLIRAMFADRVRIRITNMLRDQSTAIHFHDLHMINNPRADDTAHITQCPIHPYEKFIYELNITQTGIFWYHSHNAQQYADGLIGPIILDHDILEQRYDYGSHDYVIILQDWYHETWSDIMTATWKDNCGHEQPVQCIPLRASFFGSCKSEAHPIDEFLCSPEKSIRLRLINAASGIPFRFWIDQHNLTIVARDSIEIASISMSLVHIAFGQRLDLIVDCNQDLSVNYTIFVASRNSYQPSLNNIGATPPINKSHSIEHDKLDSNDLFFEYKYLKPFKPRVAPAAIRRITLASEVRWNNRTGIDALEEWSVNGITFEPPNEPLLLANVFDGTFKHCVAYQRAGRVNNKHVTHIQHLEYGQTYEVLMINYDSQLHPWHLHGYSVEFTAVGKIPNLKSAKCNQTQKDVRPFNYNTVLLPLNSTLPVLSVGDSFTVPSESYVVFRFTANNPGPWFLHCHMEWHIWPGMALVFSVERNGRYDGLIQSPTTSFSTCGRRTKISYQSSRLLLSNSHKTEL
ncbi:unnamed protein product [Rotaria socialis]|uniref:Uncharacterized protein n=1 Tax=Rotaria socialis TaxID=392032 RepID=A0A818E422_9BILA|nr:unnamed protein product [Rotaria socialis]